MLEKYPQYKTQISEPKSVKGFVGNVGKNLIDLLQGVGSLVQNSESMSVNPLSLIKNPTEELNRVGQSWSSAADMVKNAPGAILSDLGSLISNPIDYAYEKPIDTALWAYPASKVLKGTLKVAGEGANLARKASYVARPGLLRSTGQALEREVASGGVVPNETIQNYFGTAMSPKKSLLEGVVVGGDPEGLLQKLRAQISTMGQSPGGSISQPTYADMSKLKEAADLRANWGNAFPSPEEKLWRNISGAFGDIKGEATKNVPELQKKYGEMAQAGEFRKQAGAQLKRSIPYVASSAIIGASLYNLLKGLGMRQ